MKRPETNEHLKKKLAELRGTRAQEAVADGLGISRSTYRNWEDGTRKVKAADVALLAEYFNVSADELLGIPEKDTGLSSEAVARVKEWNDYSFRNLTEHGEESIHIPVKSIFEKLLECDSFNRFLACLGMIEARVNIASHALEAGDPDYIEGVDYALFTLSKESEKLASSMFGIDDLRKKAEAANGKHQ